MPRTDWTRVRDRFLCRLLVPGLAVLLAVGAAPGSAAAREAHAELGADDEAAAGDAEDGTDADSASRKRPSAGSESPESKSSRGAAPNTGAAERSGKSKAADAHATAKPGSKQLAPRVVVTHGEVTIAGERVAYTATTGKLPQAEDGGEPKAEIFFVAYTRDRVEDRRGMKKAGSAHGEEAAEGSGDESASDRVDRTRPITFCFNGGPGSASVWLHLGMLGPKRVRVPDDASPPLPPFRLEENPYSLLDVTDLVFIDPVSTGYSRPADGEKKQQFHGYLEDLRSVGRFLHDYTTHYGRWESPKFVLGESYGGLRAAGLAGELQQRYRMYLSGVVMVSAVVDFSTILFAEREGNNDLPYAMFLPTYTATAWRHKALADDLLALPLEEAIRRSEDFAYGPYADALLRGASLGAEQRRGVVAEYARLTGLSEQYVERSDLRVPQQRFAKELLRARRLVVGRFDSRYTGPDDDDAGDSVTYDPSGASVFGVYTAAMNSYLRDALKYRDPRVYEILTGAVFPWSYRPFENAYVTAGPALRRAMIENPHLGVFVAMGRYDLATPPTAMRHTIDHALGAPEVRPRVKTGHYEAGHMVYLHEPSLAKLRKDLVEFYRDSKL